MKFEGGVPIHTSQTIFLTKSVMAISGEERTQRGKQSPSCSNEARCCLREKGSPPTRGPRGARAGLRKT